jgi:MATE family multidrug resistance protein
MLTLAVPVVMAELGWMTMGIVDTMMVGRIGPEAIGAVSIGHALFITIALFGIGVLLGLDTLIAQAFGAGKLQDCHRSLVQGVYLSLALTVPLTVIIWLTIPTLPLWGIHPRVLAQAVPYLETLTWSLFPLLLYASFRRYLQSIGIAKPIMVALISANLVNVVGNWVLIFGHWGAPALGTEGAGWATIISRVYMALFLLAYILFHTLRHKTGLLHTPLQVELARIRRLIKLGLPAATQIVLEVGVFATAAALAGKLEPAALAAHQVALNAAAFMFMVPLGISSAGAVRVGQALGRRDPLAANRSGWMALLLGAGFMACAGLTFLLFPKPIINLFTSDRAVVSLGVSLLFVAAVFQLFDGLQVVATGVLRGAGDTRTPMICNLIGHWVLGLPVGYALCFVWGWGVVGLWIGLSLGLIAVGAVLLYAWSRRIQTLIKRHEEGQLIISGGFLPGA